MEKHFGIDAAMAILTKATSISHVFDEDAAKLGCGPIHYAFELDGQRYLVCGDDDTKNEVMVVPVGCWDLGNLLEAIDDPLSSLSVRQLDEQSFDKVAARTIATSYCLLRRPIKRVCHV